METTAKKNTATLIHLSTLTQYFIPFGNFIFPIVIWSTLRKNSNFVDDHGKQAINFQLSIFLYSLVLCLIAIPVLVFTIFKNVSFKSMLIDGNDPFDHFNPANITGIAVLALIALMLFAFIKIAEFFLVIYASVKAANGEYYQYPFCIPFIKGIELPAAEIHEDEHAVEPQP
jgi:uncharacterized Tic20 family protein